MSDYKDTKYPFRPVRCTEDKLFDPNYGIAPTDGYIYFTTDSLKLFLGTNDGFMEMCASKGFYYGQKDIEYDNSGNEPDPKVDFDISEIEGNKLPEIDDLILNIDGCFYRVKEILDENTVGTIRLTLQGTGGGTGGGGSGDTTANLRITQYGGLIRYFSQEAEIAELGVIAYSGDTTNYISNIECSFDNNFTNIFLNISNLTHALEKPYFVNIANQLLNISSRGTKIYLRVTDKYGTTRSISYTVYIASLQLTTSQAELFGVSEDTFDYRCTIGGSLGLDSRIVKFDLYNENNIQVYSSEYELEANQIGSITKTIDLSSISHGTYTLRVKIIGAISGTEITSNELVHKLLRFDESFGLPIFSALIPEKTELYTDIPISYLLVYGDNIKEYVVDIIIDEEVLTTLILTTGIVSNYNLNFDRQGIYTLKLNIKELSVNYETTLNITKYTGTLPVINIDRDDLKVYLTAKGRTNNAADKEFWPDYKNNSMKGTLSNFYYRSVNGWLTDENNVNYLKVSQGAKVLFDAYSPFNGNPKNTGLTIELDFKVSGVLDYNAHLMECISKNNLDEIRTGFYITGNTFSYWASGKELVNLNIVEGERIKLTYVVEPVGSQEFPMCYTFLNGIISDVHNYQITDEFNNSSKPGYLKIDATYGQIDIYNIRFYSSGLDALTILNNYQATLNTLELRQASYELNLIRMINGDIDLEAIESESYNLQIPYVKIVGGYQADKAFVMAEASQSNIPALPVGKKDYRAIDIEVIYPTEKQNPYFKDYKNFKMITTFDNPNLNVLNGFGKTPNTGAIMYAQGTSSLEYPVKNLRVKFKGDKIKVRPDIEAVELVTFKADFMESAGAHNTGAANFIDTAYKYANMQTPGLAYYDDETIVTCIKGHPCVIFWSPTGEKGTFKYIGKYNLNLDKATPEPFGFKNEDKFGYLTDENGDLILDNEGNKLNSIFCFEFLDNNEKVCNFLSDTISNANNELKTESERYEDTWYGTRINADNKSVPGWTIGFESRYPEDKLGLHDADALWPLASWLNALYDQYLIELASGKKPSDITNIYEYIEAKSFDETQIYYLKDSITGEYELAYPTAETFTSNIYYTRKTVSTTYAMESIRKFRDEYLEYLDPDFLLAYYVITEALLMADSRVKNMMIATWGKEHRKFTITDGTEKSVYNYIWYPIFYDMDTMLGLDNTGHVNKNYYDEDTDEGVFNGDEVLWKFVRDALPNEVAQFYTKLEQANGILTKNGILPFFNANQANMANETFYNEDAFYKYINTFRNGYQDHLNDKYIEPGAGERLYAALGSRSMMREYFIENRIKYLRGKYNSLGYLSGDRIEFRLNYPVEKTATANTPLTEEDIKINASIKAVPPTGDFNFTSLKTGYAGVKIGQNGVPVNRRFVDELDITISVDTSSANGTEAYLLGISNISSIGDISDKYIQNLVVGTSDNHLKSLIVGNHHKDYYNPYWTGVGNIGLGGFAYLEEFNLENCGSFTGTLNFTSCPQIKKILLNGSGTTTLMLPPSGVIEELRVPTSVNNFAIDSHPTLNASNFTIGYYDYDNNIYINDYTYLTHVSIKNTPIDSYELVREALLIPVITRLESYCFHNVDWEITDSEDVVIENNEIIGIKALDRLSTLVPYENVSSHAEALTGKIMINVGNYIINQYKLYNKYNKIYPNLDISYTSNNLQKASTIKFYKSETIMGDPYYTVLTDGTTTLAHLISVEGPNGKELTIPNKIPDNDEVFEFNGLWTIAEAENTSGFVVGTLIKQENFANYIPKGDVSFTANYTSTPRKYKVTLYDDDGNTILLQKELEWNDDIGIELASYYQLTYNYKEYKDSEQYPHNRYVFKGWQSSLDYNNKVTAPTWSTLNNRLITGDFVAYAYYEIEDARLVATNIDYFNFRNYTNVIIAGITYTGYNISIKEMYRNAFRGKLTLPSKYNDLYIRFLGNFANMSLITDVYFLDDNQYYGTYDLSGNQGFGVAKTSISELKNVYLPKTEYFKLIGDNTFKNCYNLTSIDISGENKLSDSIVNIGPNAFALESSATYATKTNLQLNGLPVGLLELGSSAFLRSGEGVIINSLPVGLQVLNSWCFAHCPNVNISLFGSNNLGEGLTTIGSGALYNSGKAVEEINLLNSITVLNKKVGSSEFGAFEGYAPNLNTFISIKAAGEIKDQNGNSLNSFAEVGIPDILIVEAILEG